MELLIFLIITIALILIVWRINSKTFVIQPPSYPLTQKKQEDQSNFVPTEDEKDRMRKHSSVDDSYNDRSADSPYDDDRSSILMIRLQVGLMTVVGLMIEEAVHGIAGVVPIGIAKLGL